MRDYTDDLAYGLELFPFTVTVALGLFLSGTGPALFRSLASGALESRAATLAAILVLQLTGAVIAGAGFFGGLYRVIRDAKQ